MKCHASPNNKLSIFLIGEKHDEFSWMVKPTPEELAPSIQSMPLIIGADRVMIPLHPSVNTLNGKPI